MCSAMIWPRCGAGAAASEPAVNLMQQLLLIPLLAPLLAVLLVGAINPRPALPLRLLVWTSPALPIGTWMALAAAAAAGISAGSSALALRQGQRSDSARRAPAMPRQSSAASAEPRAAGTEVKGSGPSRAPGDPTPTVEVPFRVIRRGAASPVAKPSQPAAANAQAVGDGWDEPLVDSWD